LTGKEEFLLPYKEKKHWVAVIAKIKELIAQNPEQIELLAKIQILIEPWRNQIR